jgi:hypothetical protein
VNCFQRKDSPEINAIESSPSFTCEEDRAILLGPFIRENWKSRPIASKGVAPKIRIVLLHSARRHYHTAQLHDNRWASEINCCAAL